MWSLGCWLLLLYLPHFMVVLSKTDSNHTYFSATQSANTTTNITLPTSTPTPCPNQTFYQFDSSNNVSQCLETCGDAYVGYTYNFTCLRCYEGCTSCLEKTDDLSSVCLACQDGYYFDRNGSSIGGVCRTSCYDATSDSEKYTHEASAKVRLVDGEDTSQGRLEVLVDGTWGLVCDDGWTLDNARVVCRELGFTDAMHFYKSSYFGLDPSKDFLFDDVNCTGRESSIFHCQHSDLWVHNCQNSENVGVSCNGPRHAKRCLERCPRGTFENRTYWSCDECDSNCLLCDNSTFSCSECLKPLFLQLTDNGGTCVSDCDDGSYGNVNTMVCSSCNSSCAQCKQGLRDDICIECDEYHMLFDEYCYDSCPPGTVYLLDENDYYYCAAECPAGLYLTSDSSSCSTCTSNCATCVGSSDNCTSCPRQDQVMYTFATLASGAIKRRCQERCVNGYFPDRNQICQPCQDSNCISCVRGGEHCTSCKAGYILNNLRCQRSCGEGYFNINGKCNTECKTGFYADLLTNQCKKCKPLCMVCKEPDTCASCFPPYYSLQGECVLDCSPDIAVSYPPSSRVRLMGGSNTLEGRVEVYYAGVWGPICAFNWQYNAANVVCKELQLGIVIEVLQTNVFGKSDMKPLAAQFSCNTPDEVTIWDCLNDVPTPHIYDCTQPGQLGNVQIAGVRCSGPDRSQIRECRPYNDVNCHDDSPPCFVGVECHQYPVTDSGWNLETGSFCDPCPLDYVGDGRVCTENSVLNNTGPPEIIYPRGDVTILNWPKGEKLTLLCSVQKYTSIMWYKDIEVIQATQDIRILPSGALELFSPTDSSSGLYTCVASNLNGQSIRITTVVVQEPIVITKPPDTQIGVSGTITLTCGHIGSPTPNVTWLKDGQRLDIDLNPRLRLTVTGSLLITGDRGEDSGDYSCKVENELMTMTSHATLQLQAKPVIKPAFPNNIVIMNINDSLEIPCDTTGAPEPILYWKKNYDDIHDPKIKISDSGVLSMADMQITDSGMFTCFVNNQFGSDTWSVDVHVLVEPVVMAATVDNRSDYSIGENITVVCRVSIHDLSTVTWFKDGVPLNNPSKFSLSLLDVKENDAGVYTCVASNPIGQCEDSVNILIKVPPRFIIAPQNETVLANFPAVLLYDVYGLPAPDITWTTQGEQLQHPEFTVTPSWLQYVPSYPNDTGQYTVSANNSEGVLEVDIFIEVIESFKPLHIWEVRNSSFTVSFEDIFCNTENTTDVYQLIVVDLPEGYTENTSLPVVSPIDLKINDYDYQPHVSSMDTDLAAYATLVLDTLPTSVVVGDGEVYSSLKLQVNVTNWPLKYNHWYLVFLKITEVKDYVDTGKVIAASLYQTVHIIPKMPPTTLPPVVTDSRDNGSGYSTHFSDITNCTDCTNHTELTTLSDPVDFSTTITENTTGTPPSVTVMNSSSDVTSNTVGGNVSENLDYFTLTRATVVPSNSTGSVNGMNATTMTNDVTSPIATETSPSLVSYSSTTVDQQTTGTSTSSLSGSTALELTTDGRSTSATTITSTNTVSFDSSTRTETGSYGTSVVTDTLVTDSSLALTSNVYAVSTVSDDISTSVHIQTNEPPTTVRSELTSNQYPTTLLGYESTSTEISPTYPTSPVTQLDISTGYVNDTGMTTVSSGNNINSTDFENATEYVTFNTTTTAYNETTTRYPEEYTTDRPTTVFNRSNSTTEFVTDTGSQINTTSDTTTLTQDHITPILNTTDENNWTDMSTELAGRNTSIDSSATEQTDINTNIQSNQSLNSDVPTTPVLSTDQVLSNFTDWQSINNTTGDSTLFTGDSIAPTTESTLNSTELRDSTTLLTENAECVCPVTVQVMTDCYEQDNNTAAGTFGSLGKYEIIALLSGVSALVIILLALIATCLYVVVYQRRRIRDHDPHTGNAGDTLINGNTVNQEVRDEFDNPAMENSDLSSQPSFMSRVNTKTTSDVYLPPPPFHNAYDNAGDHDEELKEDCNLDTAFSLKERSLNPDDALEEIILQADTTEISDVVMGSSSYKRYRAVIVTYSGDHNDEEYFNKTQLNKENSDITCATTSAGIFKDTSGTHDTNSTKAIFSQNCDISIYRKIDDNIDISESCQKKIERDVVNHDTSSNVKSPSATNSVNCCEHTSANETSDTEKAIHETAFECNLNVCGHHQHHQLEATDIREEVESNDVTITTLNYPTIISALEENFSCDTNLSRTHPESSAHAMHETNSKKHGDTYDDKHVMLKDIKNKARNLLGRLLHRNDGRHDIETDSANSHPVSSKHDNLSVQRAEEIDDYAIYIDPLMVSAYKQQEHEGDSAYQSREARRNKTDVSEEIIHVHNRETMPSFKPEMHANVHSDKVEYNEIQTGAVSSVVKFLEHKGREEQQNTWKVGEKKTSVVEEPFYIEFDPALNPPYVPLGGTVAVYPDEINDSGFIITPEGTDDEMEVGDENNQAKVKVTFIPKEKPPLPAPRSILQEMSSSALDSVRYFFGDVMENRSVLPGNQKNINMETRWDSSLFGKNYGNSSFLFGSNVTGVANPLPPSFDEERTENADENTSAKNEDHGDLLGKEKLKPKDSGFGEVSSEQNDFTQIVEEYTPRKLTIPSVFLQA